MKLLKSFLDSRRNQLVIIIILTLISYINILKNDFAWDDKDFLIDWPEIKSQEGLPAYLSLPYLLSGDLPFNHLGIYRPIRSVYYLLSYSIWGENPIGYHIQAIVVHTLIVLLIYLITEFITKRKSIAFVSSVLFATHPIHTESVTYITASFDTLGILFFFLSFYFYLKMGALKSKKNIYLLASIIYGSLAFFTYEMTLILPLVIILYDLCLNRFSLKKLLPHINIYKYYFLLLVIYLLIRFIILGIGNRADYLGVAWTIAANQARVGMPEVFANYLSWLAWPANLTISHDLPVNFLLGYLYLLDKIDHWGNLINLSTHIVFLYPIFYALISIVLLYIFLRKFPLVFFGSSWIVISLLPVSDIIPQGASIAERFLYIPSFGFTFLLGLLFYNGFFYLSKRGKYKIFAYILILFFPLIITFYTYQTIVRNQDWRDEKTIWQSAIKTYPKITLPYGALASIYIREGQYDKGIDLYKKSLQLDSTNSRIHSELGLAYEKKGEIEKAIEQFQQALKSEPNYYLAHIYLGNIYLKESNYQLAEEEYKSALKIKNDDPIILSYLGSTYYNDKKYDQAIEAFKKSLELNPQQPKVYLGLASSYKQKGDIQKAIEVLREGLYKTNDLKLQEQLKLFENIE